MANLYSIADIHLILGRAATNDEQVIAHNRYFGGQISFLLRRGCFRDPNFDSSTRASLGRHRMTNPLTNPFPKLPSLAQPRKRQLCWLDCHPDHTLHTFHPVHSIRFVGYCRLCRSRIVDRGLTFIALLTFQAHGFTEIPHRARLVGAISNCNRSLMLASSNAKS